MTGDRVELEKVEAPDEAPLARCPASQQGGNPRYGRSARRSGGQGRPVAANAETVVSQHSGAEREPLPVAGGISSKQVMSQ